MSVLNVQGALRKMQGSLQNDGMVDYQLPLVAGNQKHLTPLNHLIGQQISLSFAGRIVCVNCGKRTNKSFQQGHCFPCMRKLASCDQCIVKPELCHYHEGTCKDEAWGDAHCMQTHIVYLANSSGLKVGITRKTQVPTRWIDQGAVQALPIFSVNTRRQSGLVEVALKNHVADKTNWRKMLQYVAPALDLSVEKDRLLMESDSELRSVIEQFTVADVQLLPEQRSVEISYPVTRYPDKVVSLNFDKTPEISGQLLGIKGQYLILDMGVLNIRKFTGYEIVMA